MNKVMDIIKEKGIDKRLQDSVNRTASFCGGNITQDVIDSSVKHILEFEIDRNPELEDAFAEYAYDLAMDKLVEELGIKYNPDSDAAKNHSERDHAMHQAAVLLSRIICK